MTRRLFTIFLFPLLPLCAPADSTVKPSPPARASATGFNLQNFSFTADELKANYRTNETVGTGNPRLVSGNALLTADEIRHNNKTNVAVASGRVVLTRGPMRLLADELRYNAANGTFTVTAPRLGEHPYYISGREASGTVGTITLSDATLTYLEPNPLVPTLRADTLTYDSGGDAGRRIRTSNTRINIGPVPVMKLPQLSRRIDGPSVIVDPSVRVGYRGNLGAFLDVGARTPVAGGLSLGGDLGYYTKRGFLFGPSAAYDIATPGGGRMTGSLSTGYIHDNGDRLTDITGEPVPTDRGFITWRHDQILTPDLRVFGQINYWSDSEVIRDFRRNQFYGVQQPDNFLEADYARANYIISVFARAQFNTYYPVQQRLPEVRFDLLPMPVGVQGVYQKGHASAAILKDNAPDAPYSITPDTIDSHRLDAYYALYRPLAHKDIATLTPVVGARLTYYDKAGGGKSRYSRFLGEIGFDAQLRAAGTFEYKNEKWGINGLRHLVTPRLSYRYIPQADKGAAYIPAIDDRVFTTYLQPLGLGDRRDIDRVSPTNVFRVGLDNTIQTRDKEHGSRDLAILNLAADYHLDHTQPAGAHALSAIHAELALMPVEWLRFGLYQSFEPKSFALREINTGFSIHDGNRWSAGVSTHYLKNQINEYIAEGRYRLNETYEAYARLHYDARERRFNERSFGIIQKLGQNLWTIRYGVTLYEGQTRESRFGFSIDVRLAQF